MKITRDQLSDQEIRTFEYEYGFSLTHQFLTSLERRDVSPGNSLAEEFRSFLDHEAASLEELVEHIQKTLPSFSLVYTDQDADSPFIQTWQTIDLSVDQDDAKKPQWALLKEQIVGENAEGEVYRRTLSPELAMVFAENDDFDEKLQHLAASGRPTDQSIMPARFATAAGEEFGEMMLKAHLSDCLFHFPKLERLLQQKIAHETPSSNLDEVYPRMVATIKAAGFEPHFEKAMIADLKLMHKAFQEDLHTIASNIIQSLEQQCELLYDGDAFQLSEEEKQKYQGLFKSQIKPAVKDVVKSHIRGNSRHYDRYHREAER
jgi:hypothetical protein